MIAFAYTLMQIPRFLALGLIEYIDRTMTSTHKLALIALTVALVAAALLGHITPHDAVDIARSSWSRPA
jgi:hypothetical protein